MSNRRTFQSTPSAWRETLIYLGMIWRKKNFNPLPPHGGRLATPSAIRYCSKFQSTPSAWRETYSSGGIWGCLHISIHSLRMEGDSFNTSCAARCSNFNPLPPHGGRRLVSDGVYQTVGFQSTPSAWRETQLAIRSGQYKKHFNPLPPHGGRRMYHFRESDKGLFQSTPSAWRETS